MNETSELRWLTTREAAQYMRVNPQVVKRWAREGRLKGNGVGRAGRDYRFQAEALDRFMHRNADKYARR